MNSTPISVYIIAQNEESRIGTAIRSVVDWADEVIVVDSGSSDETVRVAEQSGARVLFRKWEGYGPQKSFAESECRNEWLLNIDADEEVTPELAAEIRSAIEQAPEDQAAYSIRITDLLPNESTPSWFAYSYIVLRLYHRRFGKMSVHPYQDRVELTGGQTSPLSGRILHRSFVSWSDTVRKFNFYTSQVGDSRAAAGRVPSTLRIWFEFPATFLKTWILRRLCLRGTMGMAMSITIAYLNFLRLLKTREATDNQKLSTATENSNTKAA